MAHKYKEQLTKAKLRSTISRGKFVLADVDHRVAEMRRLRDLLHLHISDMGGLDNVSHSERVLIGRASMLTLLAEMDESKFITSNFQNISHDAMTSYLRTCNSLRRYVETLGLQRRSRDVTGVTLGDLFKQDLEEQTSRERARKEARQKLDEQQGASE